MREVAISEVVAAKFTTVPPSNVVDLARGRRAAHCLTMGSDHDAAPELLGALVLVVASSP